MLNTVAGGGPGLIMRRIKRVVFCTLNVMRIICYGILLDASQMSANLNRERKDLGYLLYLQIYARE